MGLHHTPPILPTAFSSSAPLATAADVAARQSAETTAARNALAAVQPTA